MQPSLRRKFNPGIFSAASFSMKPAASSAIRKGGNLSIFVVVISVFIFGCFMYNEDIKSIAEFPFSRANQAQEIQEGTNDVFQEKEKNLDKEAAVSVVVNSRTVVQTEVDDSSSATTTTTTTTTTSSSADDDGDQKQEGDAVILKSNPENEDEEQKKIETPVEENEEEEEEEEIEIPPEECDLFTGEWVFDNVTHPLYKEDECEFLTAQVTCMRNGRKDSSYQNWRWQPRDCSLPK